MRVRRIRQRAGQGLLVLAGLINVLPGAGLLSPAGMRTAYGIEISGPDLEVVLRHRALLLALLGATAVAAAFRPHLRPVVLSANAVSFGGFLLLALATPGLNQQLVRVAQVDVAALLVLAAGVLLARQTARARLDARAALPLPGGDRGAG